MRFVFGKKGFPNTLSRSAFGRVATASFKVRWREGDRRHNPAESYSGKGHRNCGHARTTDSAERRWTIFLSPGIFGIYFRHNILPVSRKRSTREAFRPASS